MANDLLENDTVKLATSVAVTAGALHVAAVGLMDTNVLVDSLAGTQLDAAYGAIGAAGALNARELFEEYL